MSVSIYMKCIMEHVNGSVMRVVATRKEEVATPFLGRAVHITEQDAWEYWNVNSVAN